MSDLLVNLRLKAIDGVSEIAKRITNSLHEITEAGENLHKKLHGMVDIKASADALKEVGEKFHKLGESIIEPILQGAEAFNALHSKIEATGIVSNATEEEIHAMTETAMRLGRTTSINAEQAAAGFDGLASSGLTAEEQLKAIEPTLHLAKVGHLEMGQAAALSGGLLKKFSLDADALPGLLDTITGAAQASNTKVGDMAQAMQAVAPAASRLKVPIATTAALAAALAGAGIKGEQAGSTLSTIFNKLSAPRKLTKTGLDLLLGPGGTIDKATGKMKDMPTLLTEIGAAIAKKPPATADRFLQLMFGPEAAGAVGKLLSSLKGGELDAFKAKIAAAGGNLDKLFKRMEEGDPAERMHNAFSGLGMAIGKTFGPMIEKLEGFVADLVTGLTDWIERNQSLVDGLTAAAGVIGGIAIAIGAVFSVLGGMLLAHIALASFTAAFPILGAAVGAAFLPFIAAVAAVAAVTAAIVILIKHWDELNARTGFQGMMDMAREKGALKTVGALFGMGKIGSDASMGPQAVGQLGKGEFAADKGHLDPETHQWIPNAVARGGSTQVGGKLTVKVDGPGTVTSVEQHGPMGLEVDGGLATAGGG